MRLSTQKKSFKGWQTSLDMAAARPVSLATTLLLTSARES